MRCPNCSRENANDAAFCCGCGARLPQPGAPPARGVLLRAEPRFDQHAEDTSLSAEPTIGGPRGEHAETPPLSRSGELFEKRYELLRQVGTGGMGVVWSARDRRLGREVAIKRLRPGTGDIATEAQRLIAEAQAAAALDHINIVKVYDCGEDAEGPYIVMELVEGGSLAKAVRTVGCLQPARALDLTRQLCEALALAHGKGILHRDIKPGNILLTSGGVPKLVDFGLALVPQGPAEPLAAGALLGTPAFMAPEQYVDARRADARSDLWSLAGTLYWSLTGRVPRDFDPQVLPPAVRPLLVQALAEHPDQRPQTAADFAAALADSGHAVSTPGARHEDLVGACPQCGRSNPPQRKFCGQCGAPLEVACLACGQNNGITEKYCGKCGGELAALQARRRAELEEQKQRITSLCHASQHPDALRLLGVMAQLQHPQLREYAVWAQAALAETQADWERLLRQRDELAAQAQEALRGGHHRQGLELLEQIAVPLRTTEVTLLIRTTQAKAAEEGRLTSEIQAALAAKTYDALLPKVERLLQLCPHDQSAAQLAAKLRKREQQRAAERARSLVTTEALPPLAPALPPVRVPTEAAPVVPAPPPPPSTMAPTKPFVFSTHDYASATPESTIDGVGGAAAAGRGEWLSIQVAYVAGIVFLILSAVFLLICVVTAGEARYSVAPLVTAAMVSLCYLAANACQALLLYQCWSLLPPNQRDTTPAKAAWLTMIPLFSCYWNFLAFHKLAVNLNRCLDERQITVARINERTAWMYCILACCCWVPFLSLLAGPVADVVRVLVWTQMKGAYTVLRKARAAAG